MKKILKIVLILLVVLFIAFFFFAGYFVKNSVNTFAPMALGVPVTIGDMDVKPYRGLINIHDLTIGNPEGFKTDSLFKMKQLTIDIKMSSLFTDTIIVKEVGVIGPEITYESTLTGSNVGALEKQLAGEKDETAEEPVDEVEAEEEGGKKVIIEKFVLNEGQVNLSMPGMMGTALPIPLPSIEMLDIGKEEDKKGASITDVIGKIFSTIFSSVIKVVTSSGKLLGDGAKLLGDGAMAVGGATADGVGAVGGAAVDAGKAVGKGVAGAVGGVVNLFGGGSDKEEAAGEDAKAAAEEATVAE